MKKRIFAVLFFGLALSLSVAAMAVDVHEPTIEELLAPYQEVLDRLNSEYGSYIHIAAEDRERAYASVKDSSLEEFEAEMRGIIEHELACDASLPPNVTKLEEGEEIVVPEGAKAVLSSSESVDVSGTIEPRYVREELSQKEYLDNISYMILTSTVFSSTGAPNSFSYESIDQYEFNYDHDVDPDTMFYYLNGRVLYTLSDSDRVCTLTVPCVKKNLNGFTYGTVYQMKLTYRANG